MKVVILTVGSRGDVQPFLALAKGLKAAGHRVEMAVHPEFQEMVRRHGIEAVEMPGNPTGAWKPGGQRFGAVFEDHFRRWTEAGLRVAADADALVFTPLAVTGYFIAEKLGIPCFAGHYSPVWPTREHPAAFARSGFSLGGWYNLLTHVVGQTLVWLPTRSMINRVRRDMLGLPPIGRGGPQRRMARERLPQLYAYSELVAPKPEDWPNWIHVTGYWFLSEDPVWTPSRELTSFIESGSPPVFFDMGSLAHPRLRESVLRVLEGLAATGERVLLAAGRVDLGGVELSDDFHVVDPEAPHAWILPRVAAVVSHGGAGTVAACLRAGIPTSAIPVWGTMHFWGRRLYELGVGTAPIPAIRVTADAIERSVRAMMNDREMRERAAELGRQISAERGVERAVDAIHQHV